MAIYRFYTTDPSGESASPRFHEVKIACYVYPNQVNGTVPLYRYNNQNIDNFFYTLSADGENGNAEKAGYIPQGPACYVFSEPGEGRVPFHRWYQSQTDERLFTIDQNGEGATTLGYVYEGIACFIFEQKAPGTIAFHRWERVQLMRYKIQLVGSQGEACGKYNIRALDLLDAERQAQVIMTDYNALAGQTGNTPARRYIVSFEGL